MCAEVYRPYLQGGDRQRVPIMEAQRMDQDTLLERLGEVEHNFREKYTWRDELVRELFDRVAGSEVEISEELREGLSGLYLEGRLNPFLADENRTVYKTIFEAFTGKTARTVNEIKETLLAQKGIPKNVDDLYVIQRLLLAIEKLSVHHE